MFSVYLQAFSYGLRDFLIPKDSGLLGSIVKWTDYKWINLSDIFIHQIGKLVNFKNRYKQHNWVEAYKLNMSKQGGIPVASCNCVFQTGF